MFRKFGKPTEVFLTWNFHVKDNKWWWANFCYCSFTGVFKGFRANFPLSSCFSMNLLVRISKMLFKRGEPSWKVRQVSIPDTGYEEHRKFSKWHWGKVPKICWLQMFPSSISSKKASCWSFWWIPLQMIRLSLPMWGF